MHQHISTFTKRTLRTMVALGCGLAIAGAAGAMATVSVAPASSSVFVGQSFDIDLIANGSTAGVGAWDFVLALSQPARVSLTGVSFASSLGLIGSEALSFTGSDFGVVSLLSSAELLQLQQSQPFRLATLTFKALSAGTTSVFVVSPQHGEMMADADGFAVVPTVSPGNITVLAVPEPATWMLLLSGAGLLTVWRKRANP